MSTYSTPKTNWLTTDNVVNADFNRIEGNIEYLYDIRNRSQYGFGSTSSGSVVGVSVDSNSDKYILDSTGNHPLKVTGAIPTFTKDIEAVWDVGTGVGGFPSAGGSGLTLTDGTWYDFFVIGKSNSYGDIDYGYDTNSDASVLLNADNAGASGFDIYRRLFSVYFISSGSGLLEFMYTDTGRYYLTNDTLISGLNYVDYNFSTDGSGQDLTVSKHARFNLPFSSFPSGIYSRWVFKVYHTFTTTSGPSTDTVKTYDTTDFADKITVSPGIKLGLEESHDFDMVMRREGTSQTWQLETNLIGPASSSLTVRYTISTWQEWN